MAPREDNRRLLALAALSLVVHAGVLLALREPPLAAAPRAPRPLELELAWVEVAPSPSPRPAPLPPRQPKPARPGSTVAAPPPAAPAPPGAPSSATAATSTAEPAASSTGPSAGADAPASDGPRPGVRLLPSAGFTLGLQGGDARGEAPRGTTVRNGPGEQPDAESLAAYTGEVLSRRLSADLQQEVALAAVGVGNVPGHFKHYEAAMRSALPGATIDRTPMAGDELTRDVLGVLFNEGPSAEASRRVTDTPLGRSVANQSVMVPNVEDQRFREQALQLLAQGENLKERARRARLRTVLELTTDPSGALADAAIVERSGDRRFDESVLHFSRKLARALPERDDKQLGGSTWRTRWQFTWEPPDVRVRLLNAWRVREE